MHNPYVFTIILLLGQVSSPNVVSSSAAENKQESRPGQAVKRQVHDTNVIVTCDWLAEKLKQKDPTVRVLDLPLRRTNYQTGHIPDALFVDWRTEIIDQNQMQRYNLPSKQAMEKLLSRLGVEKDTTVVLTDNAKNRMSVRMYFTLKYFGHDNVRVLDGGTTAWEKSGRPLSKEVADVTPSDYRIEGVRAGYVASIDAVRKALENDGTRLIDGRPTEQYTGEKPGKVFHTGKEHKRRGHVPEAETIPWAANLNDDSTFKSLDELRDLYAQHGLDADSEVITYCNEGLHAAMPWFVLTELLGNSQTTVYDNSMSEWANLDDTPMTEGPGKGK